MNNPFPIRKITGNRYVEHVNLALRFILGKKDDAPIVNKDFA